MRIIRNIAITVCKRTGRQEYIIPGIRFRIIKLILKIFCVKSFDFTVSFFGNKYTGNTENHIDWMVYYFGAYERGILDLIRECLINSDQKVFIDVGANIGHHSLFASMYSDKVHSFEPYPKVRESLIKKIEDNDITNIFVHPIALGDKNMDLDYYEPTNDNTGSGTFLSAMSQSDSTVKLPICNAKEYFQEHGIYEVTVLKIDVEGFEKYVLSGLKDYIIKYRPTIIMEYCHETRLLFKTLENYKSFFPDDYESFTIQYPHSKKYKLSAFNFEQSGDKNIFIVPKENLVFIKSLNNK